VRVRVVIFGNSGAGKSTLARRLAHDHALAHVDLDTLAWRPTTPPTRRPLADAVAELDGLVAARPGWVIEGCYADLIEAVAPRASLLVFLNPGVDACVAHCRARPWEPHKYATPEAQDANLAMLLDWVRAYATRDDACSLAAHRALYDRFPGAKRELTSSDELALDPG
jgi:adenylate kinase family enzyme